MSPDDIAVNLVRLNGNRLNGKRMDCERLQWEAYLLSRCGAHFELTFIYHHGGPYSLELAAGWENARDDGRIKVEEGKTRYRTPYWFAHRIEGDMERGTMDGLSPDKTHEWLTEMGNVTDLVLELAAAYVFLKEEEHYGDHTIDELKIRKPLTTREDSRIQQALRLLQALGLEQVPS